eukprot:1161391-Pelagomonas_calceolata.AAC.1
MGIWRVACHAPGRPDSPSPLIKGLFEQLEEQVRDGLPLDDGWKMLKQKACFHPVLTPIKYKDSRPVGAAAMNAAQAVASAASGLTVDPGNPSQHQLHKHLVCQTLDQLLQTDSKSSKLRAQQATGAPGCELSRRGVLIGRKALHISTNNQSIAEADSRSSKLRAQQVEPIKSLLSHLPVCPWAKHSAYLSA